MKASTAIATFRRLRPQPLWRLLASDHGPLTLGLLQTHMYESERGLPASIFYQRIERELEELRVRGEHLGAAQSYVAGWLSEGYLERRFPPGASEEEYELSTAAIEAIRFVSGMEQYHSAATESRLTLYRGISPGEKYKRWPVIEEGGHSSGSVHRNIGGAHWRLVALLIKAESLSYEHG